MVWKAFFGEIAGLVTKEGMGDRGQDARKHVLFFLS